MDAELLVQFAAVASVGALGLGIAVLEPGVQPAADLFDGEFSDTAGVEVLADAVTEEEAQVGEAIMSVDAASSCMLSGVDDRSASGDQRVHCPQQSVSLKAVTVSD